MREIAKKLIYSLIFIFGIHLLVKKLCSRRALILMYHGLTESGSRDEWTQLPAPVFEKQLRYISRTLNPVSMDDAVEYLAGRKELPPNPVVVTFDDGYESNYSTGLEILKKYNVPAIVFLTSSFIGTEEGGGKLLWFDLVYDIIAAWKADTLDLCEHGLGRHDLRGHGSKARAAEAIAESLKKWDRDKRADLITELMKRQVPESRSCHRGATWERVRNSHPLLTSGAHTINHEILSNLNRDSARREIAGSKHEIEKKTGMPTRFFAYPNGGAGDYTAETVRIVSECGFHAAVTTVEGFNQRGDDLLELRRIGVGSDTGMLWFKMAVTGTIDLLKRIGL